MSAGRPRKSKEQKILEGTFQKCRDPKNVPQVESLLGVPRCPAHLGVHARAVWKSLAKVLVSRGLLSELDLQSFELLCVNIGIYRDCLAVIQKEGVKKYVDKRNSQTALALTEMNKAMDKIKQFSGLFGLTPSDRAKMGVLPSKEKTPEEIEAERAEREMNALLGGGNG